MAYWIFITSSPDNEFSHWLSEKKWPIFRRTPNKKRIRKGDVIIFYKSGYGRKKFVGSARLSSELEDPMDPSSVGIDAIKVWKKPVPIQDVISELDIIVNKKSWGLYLMGGVRGIGEKDYSTIISKTK